MTEVGQVYRDKDKRERGRYLRVEMVTGRYAYLYPCNQTGVILRAARSTRISHETLEKRFQLTGAIVGQ